MPDIRKSWDYVVEETLRTAYESAAHVLVDKLRSAAVAKPLPSRASLDSTYRVLEETCKATFVSMCGSAIESSASEHTRLVESYISARRYSMCGHRPKAVDFAIGFAVSV